MVRSILQLFGKSPFGPLQTHMKKVHECASHVPELFDALLAGNEGRVGEVAETLSTLEHEADILKEDIRAHLPKSIFLPVDRRDLLDLLSLQDRIADCAEDLGILLTMRRLSVPADLKSPLQELLRLSMETTNEAARLIEELDELVEAAFSGPEANRVLEMIVTLGRMEHEADKAQWKFASKIFEIEDQLTPGELWLWLKLGNKLGELPNAAENMGKRLHLMLER